MDVDENTRLDFVRLYNKCKDKKSRTTMAVGDHILRFHVVGQENATVVKFRVSVSKLFSYEFRAQLTCMVKNEQSLKGTPFIKLYYYSGYFHYRVMHSVLSSTFTSSKSFVKDDLESIIAMAKIQHMC
jgi:hypothetical protein